jgi:RHS repeat-associated protein
MKYTCDMSSGEPDLCREVPTSTNYKPFEGFQTIATGTSNVATSQVFDINGDGYQDLVYVSGSTWYTKLGPSFSTAKSMTSVGNAKKEYALNIDYNGDGVRDLLVADSATANWYAISYQPNTYSIEICPDGEPCIDKIITRNYTLKNLGVVATGLESGAQIMDVNGDGHEDIVFRSGDFLKAHINNGNGTFAANKTLYTFTDTVSSATLNLGVQTQTADMKSASAVDVNGDGRSDLVIKVSTKISACMIRGELDDIVENRSECEYDLGGTWVSSTTTNHHLFVSSGSVLGPQLKLQQVLGKYDDTLRIADLNGDGLSDLLYVNADKWWYRLSDGVQFLPARDAGMATSSTRKYLNQFVDLNADGRADVLHATGTGTWQIYFSRPASTGEWIFFENRGSMAFDANATVRFGDTNGDGKLNLLTSTGSDWKQYYNRKNIKEYAINSITNGFGVNTQITYKPMTNTSVYVTNASDADATVDTFSPHSGMQLVSQVSTDSNIGKKVSVSYQYGGLLVHKQGRGSLGFQMLRTIDNQTQVITETRYSQAHGASDYAQAGMPVETIQTRLGLLLSRASNTLEVLTTANGSVWPYIASSEEENYILDSNLVSTLASVTNTSSNYDDWGNLLDSTVTVTDESSNDVLTTTNTNTYGSGDWVRFGRLETASVTKTRSGDPKTHVRETLFDYYPDLLLKSSTLSPYQAATKLTTVYGYDTWGNKTSVAVTGYSTATGSNVTRTSSSNYGAKGRYLRYTDDALGFRTSFLYNGLDGDAVTGVIKSIKTTDANAIAKTENFDDLGRLSSITHPDSKTTTVTQAFCSGCQTNSYYYVRTTLTGNPTEEVYFDKWGREVAARKTAFDGTWNKLVKEYDAKGREYRTYEPNSSYFTEISYDELNRPQQVTRPNSGTVSTYLDGFESRTTNELGIETSTFQNGFGETAYTLDASSNTVTFTYDAQGNVLQTVTTGEGNVYTVKVSYDNWGRKLTTNDPSKGLWTYSYNAFGELYTQKTARNHTFTFEYDKLGRKTRSYEPNEGTLCWNYGITADKGRLISTEKHAGVNATCGVSSPSYKNSLTYDTLGRVKTTTTLNNGVSYVQGQSYDSYSRPFVTTYPSGTAAFAVKNSYNTNGYLSEVRNNATNALLKRIDTMTARNQVDKVTYGNNVTTNALFEQDTGWLSSVEVKSAAGLQLNYTDVTHDVLGNVSSRWSKFGSAPGSNSQFTEIYHYDDMNRLDDRSISIASGSAALPTSFKSYQDFNYDDWGNIRFKTGVGYYSYDVAKPHRLSKVHSDAAKTNQLYGLSYDANGNIINDGSRTFTYGSYDMATDISKSGSSSSMQYGPERELIFKSDTYIENGKSVTYQTSYLGNYEKVNRIGGAGALTEHKFYMGDIIFTQRSNGSSDTFYLHKDHQGSVTATTNANGTVVSQAIYDPWGKRTAVYLDSLLANFTYSEPTDRGYTGHKHIKELDIIHMGGRIYDPTLGRFFQADPNIQAPLNSQSYNRYAYVLNNPMSMTDPSGYFFKSLSGFVKKYWRIIAAAVITYFTAGAAAGWAASWGFGAVGTMANSIIAGAMTGFIGGAVATGSLKGAMYGALSGAVFGAIGNKIHGAEGTKNAWSTGEQMIAHGAAGGVMSSLQGGNFGHGFISAGIMKGVGKIETSATLGRTLIQAIAGGTISRLTGGKFGNGAVTAAIQYLVNEVGERLSEFRANRLAESQNARDAWNERKVGVNTYMKKQVGNVSFKSRGQDIVNGDSTPASVSVDVKALSVTVDGHGQGSIGLSQTIGEPKTGSLGYAVEANTGGNAVVSVEACAANLCQQPYAQMPVFQVIRHGAKSFANYLGETAYSGR